LRYMHIKRNKGWRFPSDTDRTVKVPYYKYWLCEKFKGANGKTVYTSVLWLGELEDFPEKSDRDALCAALTQLIRTGQGQLDWDEHLHDRAYGFYEEWCRQQPVEGEGPGDTDPALERRREATKEAIRKREEAEKAKTGHIVHLKLKSIVPLQPRNVGAEYICKQMLDYMRLPEFLRGELGWRPKDVDIALLQIISRAVKPLSEYATAKFVKRESAVCEMFGIAPESVNKDKLYRSALRLSEHYEEIEDFLHESVCNMFEADERIVVMDLTNMHVEGRYDGSGYFKYGRNKQKRDDCKMIGLAAVVTKDGLLTRTKVFSGNTSDMTTLQDVIGSLSPTCPGELTKAKDVAESPVKGGGDPVRMRRRVVVMDSGFCSEENLGWLKGNGYDYITIMRSAGLKYEEKGEICRTRDTDDTYDIEMVEVSVKGIADRVVMVKSDGKTLKERSMDDRLLEKYEQGLDAVKEGISRKHGTKNRDKVQARLGRLNEKCRGAARFYDVTFEYDGDRTVGMEWSRNAEALEKRSRSHGRYFMRTSMDVKGPKTVWDTYNTVRIVEEAFKTLKLDLNIRPICHKKDKGAIAHLHLALLAYWVVSVTMYKLKRAGVKCRWSEIVGIASVQQRVTFSAETDKGKTFRIRKNSVPEEELRKIQEALGIGSGPSCKFTKWGNPNTGPAEKPPS